MTNKEILEHIKNKKREYEKIYSPDYAQALSDLYYQLKEMMEEKENKND